MAAALEPLRLPARDGYADWLRARTDEHLAEVDARVARVRDAGSTADPSAVLGEWNHVQRLLRSLSGLLSLVANVHTDAATRELAEDLDQRVQRRATELRQDTGCYAVLSSLDTTGLDAGAARLLGKVLLDFTRSGVDRPVEVRDRVRALSERATELSQRFARLIREGGRSIRVDPDRLDGLPDDFRAAHPPGDDGLVELTTDYPDVMPVRTLATDRELRREIMTAFVTRAWPENEPVLAELLAVRRELAQLLGYADWPSYDAELKMIGSGPAIAAFVDRVTEMAREAAAAEREELLALARRDHPDLTELSGVDRYHYGELLRRERHDVDGREVRRYFAFDAVRRGLLEVTGELLGIEYVDVPDAATWHDDVTVHDVHLDGRRIGRIHLDLHPREGKYSHAAQFTVAPGVRGVQLPEGALVCNFPRGLMEHSDVVTLFHEFGHLVHHVLGGDQEWARFSGVATEWDFVEAPSQMLEEWAWDADVLARFARDEEGRPIPRELVARMRAAKELGRALDVRTQMFYAAISYFLHHDVPDDIPARVAELQAAYDGCDPIPGAHFECSFGHLGGYTSAYYTYMWSQAIAKDLFSAFDPDDLMAPDVARRYRDRVLAPGGSRDAADLVADFLGRPHSYDAFEAWLRR